MVFLDLNVYMSVPNRPLTVLVFGHSFICRLWNYLTSISEPNCAESGAHEAWTNLKIDSGEVTVIFLGFGGLNLPRAHKELGYFARANSDAILYVKLLQVHCKHFMI